MKLSIGQITRSWNEIVELLRGQFVFPAAQSPQNNPLSESEEVVWDTELTKLPQHVMLHLAAVFFHLKENSYKIFIAQQIFVHYYRRT